MLSPIRPPPLAARHPEVVRLLRRASHADRRFMIAARRASAPHGGDRLRRHDDAWEDAWGRSARYLRAALEAHPLVRSMRIEVGAVVPLSWDQPRATVRPRGFRAAVEEDFNVPEEHVSAE